MYNLSMMIDKIKNLPQNAGVYQYFDKDGKLLYIGKAKNLRNRIKSYFSLTPSLSPFPRLGLRIHKMITETKSLDYIIVNNEHDALILENSLIKQLKPKYNILLRDDKTYPYIFIDLKEDFPRFEITRKVQKGTHIKYFGPFTTASREILNALYELYPLVQKKGCLKGKKACLFYQIQRCPAPCEEKISKQDYHLIVSNALESLKNKNHLLTLLNDKMIFYSEKKLYEEAAKVRDSIKKIKLSTIISQIDLKNSANYDIFTVFIKDKKAVLIKMFVRLGKIVSITHNIFKDDNGFSKDEIYKRSLLDFYKDDKPLIAKEIIVGDEFDQKALIEEFIQKKTKNNIIISTPKKGAKKELIKIALNNAKEILNDRRIYEKDTILQKLKSILNLKRTPNAIEAYDNSHIQGSNPVGSCIFYENDFQKDRYRHYNLTSTDEYAQMKELLTKRCESFEKNPAPDLWVIDGGKTLLSLAYDISESFGVDLDIIAISKEKKGKRTVRSKGKASDKIYTKAGLIPLKEDNKVLQFIQRLRDEAHRFAIAFHRKQKLKQDKQIELLNKKGIGIGKVKKLLTYFGTFENIYNASKEELTKVLNEKDATTIKLS